MDADRIAEVVEAELARSRIPGAALAVVVNGEVALTRAFGVAHVDTGEPMTTGTVFSVQSLTKPIVATGVVRLHEHVAFSLDDSVDGHLPGVIRNEWESESPVTIRSLLTHTSGLPADTATPGPPDGTPLADFIASVAKTTRRPGEDMIYANWGYDTIGLLIERFSGVAWDRYVRGAICAPLGMRHTAAGGPPEGAAIASGHFLSAVDGNLHAIAPIRWPTIPPAAASATYSTIEDMARFLAAHLGSGGGVISVKTAEEMHRPQAAHGPTRSGMGLGFRVTYSNGRRLCCHGGDGLGFTNFIGFYPEERVGIVLTLNSGGRQSARSLIANKVLDILAGATPQTPADAPVLTGCDGEYESTYWDVSASVSTQGGTPTFTLREGLVVSDAGEISALISTGSGRLRGEGGMLHGFEAELDCTDGGVRLYGGVYPFRLDRAGDLQPEDVVDEAADLTGTWSGTIKTPLGVMPAQLLVTDATSATMTTPIGANIPLEDCTVREGRLSGRLTLTVPGTGDMEMHPRLHASSGRIHGSIYAQGWFGEISMKTDLGRV